ncbi:MAG: TrkH family potassium uptake protein [Deltaproteobacteria bacterium]|nr:TrkH family potassium uptake protein [Deltaproteobacteria bacterium]
MKKATTSPLLSIARPVGALFVGLAISMAFCVVAGALLQWWDPVTGDVGSFLPLSVSALITGGTGGAMLALARRAGSPSLTRQEGILAVAAIWIGAGIFGGLPFVLGAGVHPVDAFFEAVSGFTTTGATILVDIEGTLSRPLLLWRSLMQWLGGMGIVVLFVAIFPNLGVGAKHMYRSEVPGTSAEGLQPRIAETSITLWGLYAAFTAVQALLLWALGMSLFEAVCHAFTTMSTGGFSTRNDSVGAFQDPAIEMVITLFMLIAGVNFGLYYGALRRRSMRVFLESIEFKVYVGLVVISTLALTVGILPVHPQPLQALRYAIFMVATTITSTGYGTDAYMAYPHIALMVVVLLMFVGASSGSTAGGIKVERAVLLAKLSVAQVRRSVRPLVVQVVRMGRTAIPDTVLLDVAAFLAVFMVTLAVSTVLVVLVDGVPLPTAFGASLSAISNMGPAPWFLNGDNYAGYTHISKIVFSIVMILGRLEFFTLLALLLPDMWRR